MPARLTRRRLMSAAATVGLSIATSGCGALTRHGGPAVPPAGPDPLEPLLTAELALVARYDLVVERFPTALARLKAIRAEHVAHADALRARLDPRRRLTVPANVPPSPAAPPASAAAALAGLAAAEQEAVTRTTAACLAASGDLAALLASITASEASHAVVLS